ncbi:MAG: diaminopimelate epimerase [Clostridia bacterium]|nr:diaminopimelate epimerase [Clostridia bacterium]MDH7572144.1 diaminopimelate epimerase [Clostridia bacterium]
MRFTKMHGLGNDFVLLDGFGQGLPPEASWPDLARVLSDRHFGIGADGLVLVLPAPQAPVQMRIFNPDGSEAEMCGNAIRCVAKYAYEYLNLRSPALTVLTRAGLREVKLEVRQGRVWMVEVDMGVPGLEAEAVPVMAPVSPVVNWPLEMEGERWAITCVSMGNPHCVIFSPDPDRVKLEYWGPRLETHPLFPARTNVEVAQVLAPDKLKVRVWERGAGATLACGTGACAAVVAGVLNGLLSGKVRAELPGGALEVEWLGEGTPVRMRGPAAEVFRGEIELEAGAVWPTCPEV